MKKILILLVMLSFTGSLYSQISKNGKLSSILRLQAASAVEKNVPLVKLQTLSNKAEMERAIDVAKKCSSCKKDFYGTGLDVSINVKKEGIKISLPEGNLWQVRINSPNAFAMQFFFSKYKVPEGAELYFINDDQSMVLGAFGSHNNHEDQKFATQTIAGDDITIQYFEPKEVKFSGDLRIYKVIHAFKNIYKTGGFGASGSCTIDINCQEGNDYQDVKKSVARISFYDANYNLSAHCTGTLINTTSNDEKPYLLTANHCVTAPDGLQYTPKYRIAEWIFEFNYELMICNGSVEPTTQSVQGATLLSKGSLSDYALLDLGSPIPDEYGVIFMGWDTRDVLPSKTVSIHHPQGDVKKISIDNDVPTLVKTEPDPANPLYFNEVQGTPKTDFKVFWDQGVTYRGSSGSFLINENKKIIGQLRGGNSTCPSTSGPDYYGRLSVSWNNPDDAYIGAPIRMFLDDAQTGASNWTSHDPNDQDQGVFKLNGIEITSTHWEDSPKLYPRVSYTGNVSDLTYSWSPAADFVDPSSDVAILYFNGTRPILPFTKEYTLTVTTPSGLIDTESITVTVYDCQDKVVYLDLCVDASTEIGFEGSSQESYSWSPATYLDNSAISNPTFTPPGAGVFEYQLSVSNDECTRVENYSLTVEDYPVPPSFISQKLTERAFGGAGGNETLHDIITTSDGGYLMLNWSTNYSGTGDHSETCSGCVWLVKLNSSFNIEWERNVLNFKGSKYRAIVEVEDGYILGGSESFYLNIAKVDLQGNFLWEKYVNPPTTQETLLPLPKIWKIGSHLVMAGQYKPGAHSRGFAFVYKFDKDGKYYTLRYALEPYGAPKPIIRAGVYQGGQLILTGINSDNERVIVGMKTSDASVAWSAVADIEFLPENVILSHDDNILLVGEQSVGDQNIDIVVAKVNRSGQKLWEHKYGGDKAENLSNLYMMNECILKTEDGGYLLAAHSDSPASGEKSQPARNGSFDYWIFKIDNNGNFLGDVRYGGSQSDISERIISTDAGKYVVGGYSKSGVSGDRTLAAKGDTDTWLLEFADSNSPATNPNPERTELCESIESDFNNMNDPLRNELITMGNCDALMSVEPGAKVSMRASEKIVLMPDVHIKAGAEFHAVVGSVNLSPCVKTPGSTSTAGKVYYSNALGVEVVDDSELKRSEEILVRLFPNPTKGQLKFEFSNSKSETVHLSVYNALGSTILNKSYRGVQYIIDEFDISQLPGGWYRYQIMYSGKVQSGILVLVK